MDRLGGTGVFNHVFDPLNLPGNSVMRIATSTSSMETIR